MLGFFKLIIIAIIVFVLILGISIFNGWTLPKDEILNIYETSLQNFDKEVLSKDKQLKGKRVLESINMSEHIKRTMKILQVKKSYLVEQHYIEKMESLLKLK